MYTSTYKLPECDTTHKLQYMYNLICGDHYIEGKKNSILILATSHNEYSNISGEGGVACKRQSDGYLFRNDCRGTHSLLKASRCSIISDLWKKCSRGFHLVPSPSPHDPFFLLSLTPLTLLHHPTLACQTILQSLYTAVAKCIRNL